VVTNGVCPESVNPNLPLLIFSQSSSVMPVLFASQTAPGGPAVILPALLIAGILVAASQLFVPKGN
jgi:hypothetical protein